MPGTTVEYIMVTKLAQGLLQGENSLKGEGEEPT